MGMSAQCFSALEKQPPINSFPPLPSPFLSRPIYKPNSPIVLLVIDFIIITFCADMLVRLMHSKYFYRPVLYQLGFGPVDAWKSTKRLTRTYALTWSWHIVLFYTNSADLLRSPTISDYVYISPQ